jgi:uncharacterized protein (TIGR03067 family)
MQWHVAAAVLAGCLLVADSPEAVAKKDLEKWQGTWQPVSMKNNGKLTGPEGLKKIKLTVSGAEYHFQNDTFSEHGLYKFHAAKDPKELDIVVGEGANKGKVYLAIYKVEPDELTICLTTKNQTRPTEFNGSAGSGCILEIWRRVKP